MHRFRHKNPFQHECDLPKEYLSSQINSPYDNFFQKCLHKIRVCLSVCKNTESRCYFRSMLAMSNERKRQLLNPRYKYIIHPFSSFNRGRRIITSVILYFMFLIEAYMGSFLGRSFHSKTETPVSQTVLLLLNVLFLINTFIKFFVGYAKEKTRSIVLEPKIISRNYLLTYFLFDIIPVLSYFLFYFIPFPNKIAQVVVYELHKFRLARLITVIKNLISLLQQFKIHQSTQTVFSILIIIFLLVHEFSCFLSFIYFVRDYFNIPDKNILAYQFFEKTRQISGSGHQGAVAFDSKIIQSIHLYILYSSVVLCHFFGCGIGYYKAKTTEEMLILSIVIIIGMFFYLAMVAKVLQLFGVVNISEIRYEELNWQVNQYMIKKHFPKILKKRIFQYYDYKYGNKFFSEQEIMDSLSERLQMEVLLYSCQNLITDVRIFKGLTKSAGGCILALLKQEIYLPGEIIMSADECSGSIYFILYGTCKIQLVGQNEKELWHIEDGNEFGDTNEFSDETIGFLYQIIALEPTQIYELQIEDLKYCCKTYPEITFKLEGMAEHKARAYNNMFAKRTAENDFSEEILEELGKGKILQHGIHRAYFD